MKKILSISMVCIICICCSLAYAEENSWVCPGCGTECTTNFCMQCGMKKPETFVCPVCGEKYPIDIKAQFCGNCGTKFHQEAQFTNRLEGDGFESPEEAVTYYLEGLRNLDFIQMLRAFAWETQVKNYSVDKHLMRMQTYSALTKPRLLGDLNIIKTANLYALLSTQCDFICQSLETYVLQENKSYDYPFKNINFTNEDDFLAFKDHFYSGRLEKLGSMKNIRFLSPDDVTNGRFSNDKTQKTFVNANAMYCADEIVELPAIADVGEEILYCCPRVARYGDKWYLVSLNSITNFIIGVDTYHFAFVCSKDGISEFTTP